MKLVIAVLAVLYIVVESVYELKPVTDDEAKNFLEKFGYLPHNINHSTWEKRLSENEERRNAIKLFQKIAGLNVTGKLDTSTKMKISQPRCGVADILAVSGQLYKWNKNLITYKIESYTTYLTKRQFQTALQEAFDIWAAVTPLKFTRVKKSNADVTVKFGVREHGDPYPFDGEGGVLAHALYPTGNGSYLHFDDDEKWAYKDTIKLAYLGYTDILIVAVHEIGHVLGLDHSTAQNAIMNPYYQNPTEGNGDYKIPKLGIDDIARIQRLYGPKPGSYGSFGNSGCTDVMNDCVSFIGLCNNLAYYSFMTEKCAKTCNRCPTTQDTCADTTTTCANMRPYCRNPYYVQIMQQRCAKTCGYCTLY